MKNIEIIKRGTELYDEENARAITVDSKGAGSDTYYCEVREDVYDDETDEITGETVTTQLFTGRELAKFAGARSVWWEGDEDAE
jgi:hypothetical protein